MTFDAHILDGFNSFLLAADIPAVGKAAAKSVAATPGSGTWFDGFVVVILIFGIIRGKIRGMSQELLDVFKWLLMVFCAAHGYKPIGDKLADFVEIPVLIAYITCYLFIVVVISSIFATIKRKMGEKVFESDLFGRAEYPLGMLAGAVRYGCMILAFLAVLNTFKPDYTQVAIKRASQEESTGKGLAIVPSYEALHQGIMVNSFTGDLVREKLAGMLIEQRHYTSNLHTKTETPGKKREREVDEAVNGPAKK